MSIFVSIAAYRDPDLGPTIEDCLAKARWPDALRFGVCWQHCEQERRPAALRRSIVRLIDVPWRESKGACWARAEIMKRYGGEDHFLQLDSHHRFVQDWDALLIDQLRRTGSPRPLLTTYGTPFQPDAPLPPGEPTSIAMVQMRADFVPVFQCMMRPEWAETGTPMPARFLSAHLLFAPGRFVRDVPYDPDLYFYGEEITLAIRAFTHGYDLFHPGAHILWHQEPRRARPMHWDDHVPAQGVATSARERDAASIARVRRFLLQPQPGRFGVGTARSLADYERYAQVQFRRRYIGLAARRGLAAERPPAADTEPAKTWTVRIRLDRAAMPAPALDRPRFWYIGFHDGEDRELAREDAPLAEILGALAGQGDEIVLERQVQSHKPPRSWTVWPTDRSGRWLPKLSGPVTPEAIA